MTVERKGAVTFKGNPLDLVGPELKVGDKAPADFTLVGTDMAAVTGKDLAGKARILCAVPSLDTPVCDVEMKRFNKEAAALGDVQVYAVSLDLPFAQKRWCGESGSEHVHALSDWKHRNFGRAYGVEAPGFGLFARAVFVVGPDDVLRHVQYVPEIGEEPDYAAALAAAKSL